MRVLLIDDSPVALGHLRRHLAFGGVEVFEQPSAIGATRTILNHRIDAVVVDVTMPGLSGDKLVGVLRSNPRLKGLVIVLISAKPWDELQEIARSCSADAVMSKDDVAERLRELLLRLHRRPEGGGGDTANRTGTAS